jgi:hypothetical protein
VTGVSSLLQNHEDYFSVGALGEMSSSSRKEIIMHRRQSARTRIGPIATMMGMQVA